tara:strand:- start:1270 stop:2274 length:1005 start_codon:yes stop_codon:yes gene_type:complete
MNSKLIIIAEAGVNHNGILKKALKLVDVAAKAKADYIKFQIFSADNLCQKKHKLAKYQKKNSTSKTQHELLSKLSLSFKEFEIIRNRCIKKKIKFLASPFDIPSIKFLKKINSPVIKIPSGEITNVPYLRFIGSLKKRVILSTGMSTLKEVRFAINILTKAGTSKKNISVLHCNTEYPASIRNLNLFSIKYLKDKLGLNVGYSDHSLGYEASLIALSFGATIFEKHFTLNKNLPGPDHLSSLNPKELNNYIKKLRYFKESIGFYNKKPSKIEIANTKIVRKQIVAKKKILKGEIFTKNNITTKRASKGISAANWDKIIGKRSKFNLQKENNIKV